MLEVKGPVVVAVSSSPTHTVSKPNSEGIRLLARLGVDGDAHLGETVQHLSRKAANPAQANLRQVHLIQAELHDELVAKGFPIVPGLMGENITTRGLPVLELPRGTRLRIGAEAVVEVTGLRNPCRQLDGIAPGLMAAVLDRAEDGSLIRRAGIMAIVIASGLIRPGDAIEVELPIGPHEPLLPV